jgi:7-carboxy-7-deazaguanine synthase
MKINEIFYSLQGEGRLVGLPTIFIRATECNLRCTYCDTPYAYNKGTDMTPPEIIRHIKKWDCKRTCITGGEPLLQQDLKYLLQNLSNNNYDISLETNGSRDISLVRDIKKLVISLDIKCPSSGMHNKMLFRNLSLLRPSDQLKFVISDKKDFLYAQSIITHYMPPCNLIMQSSTGNHQQLAEWILNNKEDIRLGVQLHKIIWGDKKGV